MMPQISDKLNQNSPIEFVSKTYDIVDDPSTDAIISWTESNNSFVIWQPSELEKHILRMRFKHKNLSSFVRQLNNYGFKKVDHDRCEYAHKDFLRGQKHLLTRIRRQESGKVEKQQQQPQGQSSSVSACVEVGKFGLEEEIERLQRDKNVLMQEVVRLRQQQQSTDLQLQTLGQRLQGMEQQQQQMMSFFVKAVQSPGFLAQLVQQHNENNRRIAGVNKKRRFPNLEDGHSTPASDGQIIKYQPILNEATQAMLTQPNLASPSHRLDEDTNGDSISIDDIPSPSSTQLDSVSTSNLISNVTLLGVAPTSGHSLLSVPSGYSGMRLSAEFQSSGDVTDTLITTTASPLPDMSFFDALEKDLMQDMGLENEGTEIPGAGFVGHGTGNGDVYNDSLGADDTISPFGSGQFSPDIDVDMLVDGYTTKPPGTNGSFWEQFLTASA
ncbi:heat shock factor protein HSF8-like [Papaver somniferum]|uniref:heat shock factor protein HSF8-like n=1 Tax=Papaver somniferum TaxID=3469 RepID=UPI000E6F7005|nr:heat shock factor protein HSF8-like [Papaver somniferum]